MIGQTLQDRYRLDTAAGQGGMGTVYRAHDLLLDRPVAVKVLNASHLGTQGRNRLLQEARAAARLNHPNIVGIYDAGEAAGVSYIVMELVAGRSLYEAWPLPPAQMLEVARQVCAALEHAHTHGIVHRDLKLENILIMAGGDEAAPPIVKLTDFGLARSLASRLTQDGGLIGTVFYLAPEIALGQPVDGRADLYSLGVLLYELTTGRLPFTGDDPLAVVSQHLHAPVVPPHTHQPDLPPALDALICRLLAKEPADRPATAGEVRAVLEALLQGEAVDPAPHRSPLDHLARGRLVGREREAAEVRAHWQRAAAGEGQVLLISGEPGIGKSRLVQDLLTYVGAAGGQTFTGECYAEGGFPYGPLAQILRPALSEAALVAGLAPAQLADLLTLAPDLAAAGLGPAAAAGRSLEPQFEQHRVFESFVALSAALAARAPLLLCVEDAHWADSGTLFLLRHLARRTRRLPVLIVLTYRETDLDQACCLPEVLSDLTRERLAVRLKLGRFDLAGTRALLQTLLPGTLSEALIAAIHQETEGNPFFVEEVCKTLIEEGRLVLAEGQWRADRLDEIIIPQSVRVTLQARVAKLPEPAQEALRLAAVLGREFDFETLTRASELPEETLIAALEAAERAQLITEARRPGRPAFSFAHALIPSALREGTSRLRRQRLHRRAGLALETLRPEDYEVLAYHAEQAGDEPRARTYTLRAGERALGVYANQEAERHFRATLEALPDGPAAGAPERQRALAGLGEALFRQSQYEPAIAAWDAAVQLSRAAGQDSAAARLTARMARAAWQNDELPRGLALCRAGLDSAAEAAAAEAAESEGLAYLIHETGRACFFNKLYDEARTLCQRALEMGRRLGLVEVQAEALATLGILPGESADAHFRYLTEAVALAEAADLPATAIRGHINLSNAVREIGRPAREAYEHQLRARAHARRVGHASQELKCIIGAGFLAYQMGELALLAVLTREGRELLGQLARAEANACYFNILEALQFFQSGRLAEALRLLAEVRVQALALNIPDLVDESDSLRAQIHLLEGDFASAEAAARDALTVNTQGEKSVGSYYLLAMALADQGRPEAARQAWREAGAQAANWPHHLWEVMNLAAESVIAAAEGDWEAADARLEATCRGLAADGLRWIEGSLLFEAGRRAAGAGRPAAHGYFERAAALFRALGIEGLAALAEEHGRGRPAG